MADAASIKRAFDIAFTGMLDAPDFHTVEAHFGHALGDLYRLYELAGQPPSSEANRNEILKVSEEGRIALAMAWSRKFRTHDLIEVTQPGDRYTDYYTDLYGTLIWRDGSYIDEVMTSPTWKKPTTTDEIRAIYYKNHLSGKPVLDTLQRGIGALLDDRLKQRPPRPTGQPGEGK